MDTDSDEEEIFRPPEPRTAQEWLDDVSDRVAVIQDAFWRLQAHVRAQGHPDLFDKLTLSDFEDMACRTSTTCPCVAPNSDEPP